MMSLREAKRLGAGTFVGLGPYFDTKVTGCRRVRERLSARSFQPDPPSRARLLLVEIGDRDVGPLTGEGDRHSYCGQTVDERVKPPRLDLLAKAIKPDDALGSHSASLGITFVKEGGMGPAFPAGAFIGQHGNGTASSRLAIASSSSHSSVVSPQACPSPS